MAYEFYITVTGKKQGKFKDECKRHVKATGQMIGLEFLFEAEVPRDRTTGQSSGRRHHLPLRFVKETGVSSPQFLSALFNNETLSSVLFEFIRVDVLNGGGEAIYQTIALENAHVISYRMRKPHDETALDAKNTTRELDEIELAYEKITIENKNAKTMASDSWVLA